MQITVTDAASKWFREDMGLTPTRGVRFYGKVYGKTPVHDGFSLAMTPDSDPKDLIEDAVKDGVHYYVSSGDEWFFKGYDLAIDYDPSTDGPKYDYIPNGEL